jgi:hypothetical protein
VFIITLNSFSFTLQQVIISYNGFVHVSHGGGGLGHRTNHAPQDSFVHGLVHVVQLCSGSIYIKCV